MKNGIPYEVARNMEPAWRLAYIIVFGQLEGGKWNWDAMEWEQRNG